MSTKERLSRLSSVRRLQELERQSSVKGEGGMLAFLQAMTACCGCCVFCLLFIMVMALSATGIAKIVMGAIYLHHCEIAPMIPIFLIVSALMPSLQGCSCQKEKSESGDGSVKLSCRGVRFVCGLIVVLFELAWLIAMTVFVLRARSQVAALPAWCSDPSLRTSTPPPNSTALPGTATTTPALPTTTTTATDLPSTTATTPNVTNSSLPLPTSTGSTSTTATTSTSSTTTTTTPTTTTGTMPTGSPSSSQCKTCDPRLLSFAFGMVVLDLTIVCFFAVAILCVACMYGMAVCTKD